MTRKMIQIRNLIMAILVGECALLFGLYLLLNTSILLTFSVYALIKNIIIFTIKYLIVKSQTHQKTLKYTLFLSIFLITYCRLS